MSAHKAQQAPGACAWGKSCTNEPLTACLPGRCLPSRAPPTFPQTHPRQTLPHFHPPPSNNSLIDVEQIGVNLEGQRGRWFRAAGFYPHSLCHAPPCPEQGFWSAFGASGRRHSTLFCQPKGGTYWEGDIGKAWPAHTWGNKLAISTAHLPVAWIWV